LATIVDEHFDWFSIAGETLTSDELIQLLENKSFSPALAKRMAEDIWDTHENWKEISAKETVESAQEKRRKYEQAERLNETSIHQIREKQLESGGSIEGEDVLLSDAFRTNQKSAVLIVTDPTTNKERYYRVSAGHEVTEDEPELMSIYITPIGEDGNIDASIVKKSSDRVEGMW
jgi:hypothetical protein